jgi:hypothetical protein
LDEAIITFKQSLSRLLPRITKFDLNAELSQAYFIQDKLGPAWQQLEDASWLL